MTTAYVVQHTKVGHHREGTVIAISDDDEAAGVSAQRLLEKGAIREATPEEAAAGAIPIGQHSGFVDPGFPIIPDGKLAPLPPDGTPETDPPPEPPPAAPAKGRGKKT